MNSPSRPQAAATTGSSDRKLLPFAELHPPLSRHEALIEADRCYFCHDAPCIQACPTGIDIPLFIRQIAADNPKGAARTIFDQNILGGICARVCPTETLCEQACVREAAEGKPVKIGMLQRYATDIQIATGQQPYQAAAPSNKTVGVIGAGPAGLACAHRLALNGHKVSIYDARPKPGGLNEYGIAAYKTVDNFAQREVDYILAIGGITIETGRALGRDLTLDDLLDRHDAVFLGLGLSGVNRLGIEGEELLGVLDAVEYIATLRQCENLASLPIGRQVVVIGGGMTAIDAAVQATLLGAEEVTIAYRQGPAEMKASAYEQELARMHGVSIRHFAVPVAMLGQDGQVKAVRFERSRHEGNGGLARSAETFDLPADMVFKAVGQRMLEDGLDGIALERGRILVDQNFLTSRPRVWAGGDCIAFGQDLTVEAVEHGKRAAMSIHLALTH